jgi:hypothetical protein
MKLNPTILPILASATMLAAGCQLDKKQVSQPSSVIPQEVVSAATAPTNPPARVRQEPVRIKAGPGAIKDSSGNQWLEDQGFSGGDVIDRPHIVITNSPDPAIYLSEHYAMDSFTYRIPNGKYQVKLHFCETYEGVGGPGDRVFSFTVEDQPIKDFDVWAKAGGWGRAHVETVNVDVVDGQLDIKFTPQVENPQINGIEIVPVR